MYNDFTCIGNLGKDPEQKTSQAKGTTFTTFSVAVNKQGALKDEKPLWVNATAFGATGDYVFKYLKAGNKVLVQGPIELREFEGNDGKTRTSLQMIANKVVNLTPRDANAPAAAAPAKAATAAAATVTDEDIPF